MGDASNRKSPPCEKSGLFKEFKGPLPAVFSAHLRQAFTVQRPRPIDWLYCKKKIVRRKAGLRTRARNRPRNGLTRLPMEKRALSKGVSYPNPATTLHRTLNMHRAGPNELDYCQKHLPTLNAGRRTCPTDAPKEPGRPSNKRPILGSQIFVNPTHADPKYCPCLLQVPQMGLIEKKGFSYATPGSAHLPEIVSSQGHGFKKTGQYLHETTLEACNQV